MNAIERCAQSGPKKLTKTYNKGFPNHSTLINYGYHGFTYEWDIKCYMENFGVFLYIT